MTHFERLDVISGIGDGDNCPSHPNFLAGSNINSKQAFDALMRGHPVTQKLAGLASWHYNIQDTSIPALDYRFDDCAALHECLKELNSVSERNGLAVRRETEAREQLVVDLGLSRDVYSARPFAKLHSSAGSEGTLNPIVCPRVISYSEEPPEVKFGYFRPVRKAGADHYAEKEQDGQQDPGISSPIGVRLLLAEWELGTDPNDYTYRDPYGLADIDIQPVPQYRKPPATAPVTQKKQMPPQRPPPVVAAAIQPPIIQTSIERTPVKAQSQAGQQTHSQQPERGPDERSQEAMTSTQVLPGPYGGRPGKKAGKRRMGGF